MDDTTIMVLMAVGAIGLAALVFMVRKKAQVYTGPSLPTATVKPPTLTSAITPISGLEVPLLLEPSQYVYEQTEVMGPAIPFGLPDYLDQSAVDRMDPSENRWTARTFWSRTEQYNNIIYTVAKENQMANNVIRAIMMVESAGENIPKNHVGAMGLMQIKLATAQQMKFTGTEAQLMDPRNNIAYGVKYLRWQLTRYAESYDDMAAAYHYGSVFRWKKGETVLPSLDLATAQKYGKVVRLNSPYNHSAYGPYHNQYYVDRFHKFFDLFNKTIFLK